MLKESDSGFNPGSLLRSARARAGLTQRELARRAGTSQSVIARIEGGRTSPTATTLQHLFAAAGFELDARLVPRPSADSHMLEDISRILELTPEERLREIRDLSRFEAAARRA